MTFHDTRLEEQYERGASGGPGFDTTVTPLSSGHEQRNGNWQRARARYNIGYGVQTKADYSVVLAFFLARRGRLYGFRFKDWADYDTTDEAIGVGNNVDTQFQLVKTYEPGSYQYVRPITKPVASTLVVKLDGVATTAFTLDSATGVITFDSAPATDVVITATFEFDVPVRFDEDNLDVALQWVEAGTIPSIAIIELRQDDVELNP